MLRLVVILTLVSLFFCSIAVAQDRGFGLGIILGEPTGLSCEKWCGSTTAVDGAVAWSFGKKNVLHLHADYLVHNFNLFKVEEDKLALYYGIGGRIKIINGESRIGFRIPVGINYIFEKAPLDIFFELVPLLDLVPSTDFRLKGAIGVRYYFGRTSSVTSPKGVFAVLAQRRDHPNASHFANKEKKALDN